MELEKKSRLKNILFIISTNFPETKCDTLSISIFSWSGANESSAIITKTQTQSFPSDLSPGSTGGFQGNKEISLEDQRIEADWFLQLRLSTITCCAQNNWRKRLKLVQTSPTISKHYKVTDHNKLIQTDVSERSSTSSL